MAMDKLTKTPSPLALSQKINELAEEKPDKAPPSAAGNLAALDRTGNLQDSGKGLAGLYQLDSPGTALEGRRIVHASSREGYVQKLVLQGETRQEIPEEGVSPDHPALLLGTGSAYLGEGNLLPFDGKIASNTSGLTVKVNSDNSLTINGKAASEELILLGSYASKTPLFALPPGTYYTLETLTLHDNTGETREIYSSNEFQIDRPIQVTAVYGKVTVGKTYTNVKIRPQITTYHTGVYTPSSKDALTPQTQMTARGRNLLRGCDPWKDPFATGWTKPSKYAECAWDFTQLHNGHPTIRLRQSEPTENPATGAHPGVWQMAKGIEYGKRYTISGWFLTKNLAEAYPGRTLGGFVVAYRRPDGASTDMGSAVGKSPAFVEGEWVKCSYTLPAVPKGAAQLWAAFRVSNAGTIWASELQLEEGTAATEFDPEEQQHWTVPGEHFSLPNGIKDEVDITAGREIQRVGKIELTGEEEWYKYGSTHLTECADFDVRNVLDGNYVPSDMDLRSVVCDRFPAATKGDLWQTDQEGFAIRPERDGFIFNIRKSRLTGWADSLTDTQKVELFKTWLRQHPVTVLYEKKDGELTQISPRPVKSYGGKTQILSLPEAPLQAEFGGNFVNDVEKAVGNALAKETETGILLNGWQGENQFTRLGNLVLVRLTVKNSAASSKELVTLPWKAAGRTVLAKAGEVQLLAEEGKLYPSGSIPAHTEIWINGMYVCE